ncbi:MAG: outer membrane lipoprotein carrier protein LolA, partial [Deltaproteobacteria bacterium]|nr:outer membrane lipoprotein carrier protein LolA [Deltaproteobacteria bacterium]
RLRLIQDSPLEEEMVISPKGIWWYTAEDNEAHRYPASEFFVAFTPIMDFFKGLGDYRSLEKGFRVSRLVGADKGQEKAVKLVPLSHKSGLDRLEIWIRPGGVIVQVAVYSLAGDRNIYRFKDVEILDSEPTEGFGYTPPQGAKIVHH